MAFIVFSGLPASGKSTLARQIAPRLRLPLLDKDDFLDRLFAERGVGDAAWRAALSREADAQFTSAAQQLPGACLVSWWRHPHSPHNSGTVVDWLTTLRGPLIEIRCECRVETAVERFVGRRRHAGHLDETRSRDELLGELTPLASFASLDCDMTISVDTGGAVDIGAIVEQIRIA